MASLNPRIAISVIVISILLLLIKLFTTVIILADDPTSFLVLRFEPSLESKILLSSIDTDEYVVLLSDENGFIGQNIYTIVTSYLWWIALILSTIYAFSCIKSLKNQVSRAP
ncbi:hypothetical protein ACJJIF_02445 [Microbulbifer sp. SSSA002]|uniref:hypothetical protein n=1 Tax=Microbulbifer sp. SSSA002 TaxID=3243376 RepID=UPI004039B80D